MTRIGILIVTLLSLCLILPTDAVVTADEAPVAQSIGMRQFYLTTESYFYGDTALTACAPGYHMASMWEIADPTNLKYNTSLGYTVADSGQGPQTHWPGWVRTGYAPAANTIGRANCVSWMSNALEHDGTRTGLPNQWTAGDQDVDVWIAGGAGCNSGQRVWCVED